MSLKSILEFFFQNRCQIDVNLYHIIIIYLDTKKFTKRRAKDKNVLNVDLYFA